ncbi:hypothetical protein [Nonomuraea rubra]|uniref:Uncharacterized protein n=1 Tax=Nonomuraea rubra TaxID=46180 RepID=A0A7X0P6I1_9ACTN|nr:hypothetical protein [Nonomuraea rubra]MBB6556164.1 hypothetical protein [Nonomuraea rubra]
MNAIGLAAIRAALESLPAQCRYHGDSTEPPANNLFRREACCDTGIPAQRRKEAEQALIALGWTPPFSTVACNDWSMSKEHPPHEWDGDVRVPGHFTCPGWPSAGER